MIFSARPKGPLASILEIWPYDFGAIPIEAISAIYERFLKTSEKLDGAFYTPRFLAELVLDVPLQFTFTS